jgi:hypothetical protein
MLNHSWVESLGKPVLDEYALALRANELDPQQLFRFIKEELSEDNTFILLSGENKTIDKRFIGSEELKKLLGRLLGLPSDDGKVYFKPWSIERKLILISSLLQGFPSLSEEIVELLLRYMELNLPIIDKFTSYSIGIHKYLVEANNVSPRILIAFMEWIMGIYADPIHYYFFDYEPLKFIFDHRKFPEETLLEYCYSNVPHIRDAASSSLKCPIEGKIVVALRELSQPQERYIRGGLA